MELVYLWVENYKNIHYQGFNFSPRFECKFHDEYDENNFLIDDCRLRIKPKKYIQNFFNKNINISIIVGKNGSGKSSLLKVLIEEIIKEDKTYKIDYKHEYGHMSYGQKVELFFFNEIENKKAKISDIEYKDIFIVYWDYAITDEAFIDIKLEDIDCYSFDEERRYIFQPRKIDLDKKSKIDINDDIQELAFNLIESNFNFEIVKYFFNPKNIYIQTYQELVPESLDEGSLYHDKVEVSQHFYYYHKDKKSNENIFSYSYAINNEYIYNNIKTNELSKKNSMIDFIGENGKSLLTLSFGEIQLLKILYNISSLIKKITLAKYKSILFLLDELELGLHPQWQKKIISFLTNIETKIPVHFILISHSPFLLSDIPKQNIIFLDIYDEESKEKYPNLNLENLQNGDCINVSNEIDIKPFGANIHELLSHGFFMEDGLIGEFALKKIQNIVIPFYTS